MKIHANRKERAVENLQKNVLKLKNCRKFNNINESDTNKLCKNRKKSTMKLILILVLVSSLSTLVSSVLPKRPRQCCRYNNDSSCPDPKSCTVLGLQAPFHPSLERCVVNVDSKRDTPNVGQDCLAHQYLLDENRVLDPGVARVRAYLLETESLVLSDSTLVPGIEVMLAYDLAWERARFRITNAGGCQVDTDSRCSPRCVDVDRKGAPGGKGSNEFFLYDCEVGLYVDQQMSRSTADSTYQLDVCLDDFSLKKMCGSYLFWMPNGNEKEGENLILLERKPLLEDRKLVLHIPPDQSDGDNMTVKVTQNELEVFNEPLELTKSSNYGYYVGEKHVGYDIEPGIVYSVQITTGKDVTFTVAQFHLLEIESTGVARAVVLFFLVLALIAAMTFVAYRQYKNVQKSSQVNPARLVESGRIHPRNVIVITNVDNRHHIDVVLGISKYLKAHCAVGEVYFALDPNTGINSQPESDPWKWAQMMADKMNKEDGFLLFIGAPPAEMGISIYKELPNNQAFVSTAFLKSMCDENRVAVLHLPYSDPETIPTLLPPHVRSKAYNMPRDTNAFLCQLLEVKKRELFTCIPVPIVRPEILPHDLCMYKGGKELLADISSLSAKVDLFKAEQKQQQATAANGGVNNTLGRTEDSSVFSDSEEKGLLRPKKTQ